MLMFEHKQHLQSNDAHTELLIDHPFKLNISGERGSDDKKFENV